MATREPSDQDRIIAATWRRAAAKSRREEVKEFRLRSLRKLARLVLQCADEYGVVPVKVLSFLAEGGLRGRPPKKRQTSAARSRSK